MGVHQFLVAAITCLALARQASSAGPDDAVCAIQSLQQARSGLVQSADDAGKLEEAKGDVDGPEEAAKAEESVDDPEEAAKAEESAGDAEKVEAEGDAGDAEKVEAEGDDSGSTEAEEAAEQVPSTEEVKKTAEDKKKPYIRSTPNKRKPQPPTRWNEASQKKAAANAAMAVYTANGDLRSNPTISKNIVPEIYHHHYGIIDARLSAAISELERTIDDFKKAKEEMKHDSSIVNRMVKGAQQHLTKWWKDSEEAVLQEKVVRQAMIKAEAEGKEDALMSTFKVQKPAEVLEKLRIALKEQNEGFEPTAEWYIVLREKFNYFWSLMNKDNIRDKVLIKTWIYTQQSLYFSAFRELFKTAKSGGQGQNTHGLDFIHLEEILKAVLTLINDEYLESIGSDGKEWDGANIFVDEIDPPVIQMIRDVANSENYGLKPFVEMLFRYVLKDPRQQMVDKIVEQVTAYMRPSEKKLWDEEGVRPEIVRLKNTLDLGSQGQEQFDKDISKPLSQLLDKLATKPVLLNKCRLALKALGNQQYVSAIRIILKNEDSAGGLKPDTINVMIDMTKKAAGLKIANKGLALEISRLLDTLKSSEEKSNKLNRLRELANDETEVDMQEFAAKLIQTIVPADNMQMMATMFLDKISAELPDDSMFSEYMPPASPSTDPETSTDE